MSKVQVDKVVNLSDDGAPQLTYGAELPVGYGLTGAGGVNISGVCTAASFSGTSADFSGNVTIGGTLTYEDVTNIDVVGVSTFAGRMNVNSSALFNEGLSVTAGVTTIAGTTTFGADITIPDKIIHSGDTNTSIRFPAGDEIQFETGGSNRLHIGSGNITQTIDTDGEGLIITTGSSDMKPMVTGNSNRGAENNTIFGISGKWNNTEVGRIAFEAGADTTNKDDGKVKVYTRVSGGSLTSRLLIDSVGQIQLNTDGSQTASNISVGAGADLKLYHDGSDSYIRNISNTDLRIQNIGNAGIDIYNQNSYPIIFTTNGSERARLDANGRLLIGTAANQHNTGHLLQAASASSTGSLSLNRYSANAYPSYIEFFKSRNASVSGQTVVQDGDNLGQITWSGSDGTNRAYAAFIDAEVDGTPGDGDMPGRLTFSTSADGSESPSERLRITSTGQASLGSATVSGYDDRMLTLYNSNTCYLEIRTDAGDYNSGVIFSKGSAQDSDSYRGYIAYNHSTDRMTFHTGGGTRRGMFDANGLHFDTNNNSAETGLDDYEEGTWSPTLTFGGGSTSMTYSVQSGYYVKIGRLVNVGGTIILTAKGSSTGAAQIESLPFTIGNNDGSTSAEGGGFLTYWINMATDKLDWTLRGSHNSTTANVSVSRSGGHTAIDNATEADFSSSSSIRFVMTYQA